MAILCVILAFVCGVTTLFAIDGIICRKKLKKVLKESIEDNEKMIKIMDENKTLRAMVNQQATLLMRQGVAIQQLNDNLFM